MLNCQLDEAQSLPERQIRRARVSSQALRRTANDDANRVSGAAFEDIGA